MPVNRVRRAGAAAMRGLSLVELMVGIAVSMFVVAAAALLVSSQLSANRRLLLETQLQQDLRATADIITRELRRGSYWASSNEGVPTPAGGAIVGNPMRALAVNSAEVHYKYRRGSGLEAFGFRLDGDGVIRACQSDGSEVGGQCNSGWQDLTDTNTVEVRSISLSSTRAGLRARTANDDTLVLPCPNLCADGTTACWPTVGVREVTLTLTGRSRNDSAVERTLTSSVRVRNDRVDLSNEAPTGQSCPAS